MAFVCMLSHFSHVWHFVTLWPVACQAPLSMEFLQAEIMVGVAMPSSGDLPNPAIEPMSLTRLKGLLGNFRYSFHLSF